MPMTQDTSTIAVTIGLDVLDHLLQMAQLVPLRQRTLEDQLYLDMARNAGLNARDNAKASANEPMDKCPRCHAPASVCFFDCD